MTAPRALSDIAGDAKLPAAAPELKRMSAYEVRKSIVIIYNGLTTAIPREQLVPLHAQLAPMELKADLQGSLTLPSLLARAECLLIDVQKAENLEWYSRYRSVVEESDDIVCVFVAPSGSKVTESQAEMLRKKYAAQYVCKRLPTAAASKNDYITRLLSDHISSSDAEECCAGCISVVVRAALKR